MKPSEKSPGMTNFLENVFGRSRSITHNVCVSCGRDCNDIEKWDALTKKEYTISGLCNECQRRVFG